MWKKLWKKKIQKKWYSIDTNTWMHNRYTRTGIYTYTQTHIYRMWWVHYRLNYAKIKIPLISEFIKYIYQNYRKISQNLFKEIAIGCSQASDDFRISWKYFRRSPGLNWEILILSLPLAHLWCCTECWWSFVQPIPHIIINKIAIWWVRRPDVRGDVVAEFFHSQDWVLLVRINFFYLLRTFCPHLVSLLFFFFLCCFFFTTFQPNFTSGLLQVINHDLG